MKTGQSTKWLYNYISVHPTGPFWEHDLTNVHIRDICSLKICQLETLNLIFRDMRQLNAVLLIFGPIAYISGPTFPHACILRKE